jgi:hypothetical protein
LDQTEQYRQQQVHDAGRSHSATGIKVNQGGAQLFRAAHERARRDVGEGYDDIDESDPNEGHHRAASASAEVFACNLGYGCSAMSDRCSKADEVMNSANEHYTQTDPQQARQPAKSLTCQNGTCNRSGCGDCREVLAKEIKGSGGNKVDAVIHAVSRSSAGVVNLELPCDPGTVQTVSGCQ